MHNTTNKRFSRFITLTMLLTSLSITGYAAPSIAENEAKVKELAGAKKDVRVENKLGVSDVQGKSVFKINTVKIDTELKLKAGAVRNIIKPYEGKTLGMEQLNELANKLTGYCRSQGFPAATAYVPEQKIKDRIVTIGIIPGRIGKINIENKSKLSESTIRMLTSRLKSGKIMTTKQVETVLYSLNDLGGISAVGVLSPGLDTGTSDVTVKVADGKVSNTILYAENYGTHAAGRYRYVLTEDLFNIDRQGGHLNAGVLISNHDLHNYTISYERPVGHSATTLGIGFSRMDYELGGVFSNLNANGISNTYSIYGSTPLWKKTSDSMRVTYGYDYKKLTDNLDKYTNMNADKHSHAIYLGLAGQNRNNYSASTYSLTGYTGMVGMDSDYANYLNSYNNTEGRWSKVVLDGSHVHKLDKSGNLDLYIRFQGQKASRNLDSSEKLFLGGANGVRAYPQGEGSGDEGILASAEVRYHTKVSGLTFSVYLDGGHVNTNKDGSGGNETLKGWGIGVTYAQPSNYFMRFDYARRIGLDDQCGADSKAKQRMWFLVGKIW